MKISASSIVFSLRAHCRISFGIAPIANLFLTFNYCTCIGLNLSLFMKFGILSKSVNVNVNIVTI